MAFDLPLYSKATGLPIFAKSDDKPMFGDPDNCECCGAVIGCPCSDDRPTLSTTVSSNNGCVECCFAAGFGPWGGAGYMEDGDCCIWTWMDTNDNMTFTATFVYDKLEGKWYFGMFCDWQSPGAPPGSCGNRQIFGGTEYPCDWSGLGYHDVTEHVSCAGGVITATFDVPGLNTCVDCTLHVVLT